MLPEGASAAVVRQPATLQRRRARKRSKEATSSSWRQASRLRANDLVFLHAARVGARRATASLIRYGQTAKPAASVGARLNAGQLGGRVPHRAGRIERRIPAIYGVALGAARAIRRLCAA